jgi:hypothetical protein
MQTAWAAVGGEPVDQLLPFDHSPPAAFFQVTLHCGAAMIAAEAGSAAVTANPLSSEAASNKPANNRPPGSEVPGSEVPGSEVPGNEVPGNEVVAPMAGAEVRARWR